MKPTVQWAEEKLRMLSEKAFTGTVTIRFAQGGVQSMVLSQELHPNQELQARAQAKPRQTDERVSTSIAI